MLRAIGWPTLVLFGVSLVGLCSACIHPPTQPTITTPDPALQDACNATRSEHNTLQVLGVAFGVAGGGAGAVAAPISDTAAKVSVIGGGLGLAVTGAVLVVIAGLEADQLSQGHCSEVAP
jgi:hypothetical protein